MRIPHPMMLCAAALLLCADGLAGQRGARRTWVIPHVLERAGRITTTPNSFDTELHMVNLDRAAVVEISVFESNGEPLRSRTGQAVCNPCTVTFAAAPKQVFSLEERIEAAGGFARSVVTGYAVITSRGSTEVAMQGFVINSHTGPFDLSVFGFTPEEVRSTAAP